LAAAVERGVRRLLAALLAVPISTGALAAADGTPVPAETPPGAAKAEAPQAEKVGILKGLDKITARVSTLEIPVGETVAFGTLRIKLDTCHKRPPEEPPETTAFLEIDEERPGDSEPTRLFTGWMFASSPALSALEHPVYDVWVIDCKTVAADSSAPAQEKSAR
jgi:hypothetical protein